MLADSYIVPECTAGPGSFGGLMALYESNFIRLVTLVGEPAALPDITVSESPLDLPLHLSVEQSSKYTRLLRLTYLFEGQEGAVADPDLLVRVYLDARVAEVRGWAPAHRHGKLRELQRAYARELDRRWSRNMMLSKWLEYLLDMRHRFAADAADLHTRVPRTVD